MFTRKQRCVKPLTEDFTLADKNSTSQQRKKKKKNRRDSVIKTNSCSVVVAVIKCVQVFTSEI